VRKIEIDDLPMCYSSALYGPKIDAQLVKMDDGVLGLKKES